MTRGIVVALGMIAAAAMGCAQQHTNMCPQLDEAMAADAMIHTQTCARWASCYRDSGFGFAALQCIAAREPDSLCEGLANGTLVFHPEHVDACAAALAACAARPCFVRVDPNAFPATGPCEIVRDACSFVFDDLSSAPCSDSYSFPRNNCVATGECGGTLAPLGVAGAPCGSSLRCEAGLHCGDPGICTEACTRQAECTNAARPGEVGACVAQRCSSVPHAELGELCADGPPELCASGTYCHHVTGRCTVQAAPGGNCDPAGSGVFSCVGWLECDMTGTCVYPGFCGSFFGCPPAAPYCTGDLGTCTADASMQACDLVYTLESGSEWCSDGRACVDTLPVAELTGRCLPIAALGTSCDASVSCVPGTSCASGRCTHVVAPGESCDASVACGELYACIGGRCEIDPDVNRRVGATCSSDGECETTHCRDGLCAWLAPGEPCSPGAFECQFECTGMLGTTGTCGSGEPAGLDVACTASWRCAVGLTCLPRPDGVSVCRPLCAP